MKCGANIMSLEDIPTARFFIFYNHGGGTTCEVEVTLAPFKY